MYRPIPTHILICSQPLYVSLSPVAITSAHLLSLFNSLIYGSVLTFDVSHIVFGVWLPEEPVMSMALRFLHLMTVRVILPAVGR